MIQPTVAQLINVSAHIGHRAGRWNPLMSKFLSGTRKNIHLFDVTQTVVLLRRALWFLNSVITCRGKVLFIGPESKFHREAVDCEHYFLRGPWVSGLLTNFKHVRKKVRIFRTSKVQKVYSDDETNIPWHNQVSYTNAFGAIEQYIYKYKPKDNVLKPIPQKDANVTDRLQRYPNLLIILSLDGRNRWALSEARKVKIPVIAIVDSDNYINGVTYPIPGNNDSRGALHFYLRMFMRAIDEGRIQERIDMLHVEEEEEFASMQDLELSLNEELKKKGIVVKSPIQAPITFPEGKTEPFKEFSQGLSEASRHGPITGLKDLLSF